MSHHNTIRSFQQLLLSFYAERGRDLPWRPPAFKFREDESLDPYAILVSEIMLQQTQVNRVKEKWPPFLKQFPTIKALAAGSRGDVLRAWQGMGYNRRALNLQRAAQEIIDRYKGVVPRTWKDLRALSGVGDYTASAIRVFAFNECDVAVDGNVRRVMARHLFGGVIPDGKFLRAHANRLVPEGRARDFHSALMDFGSMVCVASVDQCDNPHCTSLRDVQRRRRAEPSHRGIPRRIWRGRIVEELRQRSRGLRRDDLTRILFETPNDDDRAFIAGVLRALADESMLSVRGALVRLPR